MKKIILHFHLKYRSTAFLLVILISFFGATKISKIPINLELDKLLPENSVSVKEMKEVSKEVGGIGHLNVLIGPTQNPQKYLDALSRELKKIDDIKYFFYKTENFLLRDKILYLIENKEFLELQKNARILFNKGQSSLINLGIEDEAEKKANLDSAKKYFEDFKSKNEKNEYLISEDKKYVLLMIKPSFESVDLERSENLEHKVNNLIKTKFSKLPFILMGRYVEKVKDTRQIQKDIQITGIFSLSLIIIFLIVGLGSFRGALFVVLGVFLSLGWTVLITYYLVGQINILTGFLVAILAGLGADYGIHLFKRFREELDNGLTIEQAMSETYLSTGRALFSSSMSTATAFLCLIYSDFRGFSELGIIAGLGIVSIFIVFMLTFPIFGHFLGSKKIYKTGKLFDHYPFKSSYLKFLTPIVFIIFYGIISTEFEYDFNRMRDLSAENYNLRIFVDSLYGKTTSPVGIMSNNQEHADKIKDFLKNEKYNSIVNKVVSLSDIYPTDMERRYRKIKKLEKLLDGASDSEISNKTGLDPLDVRKWFKKKPFSQDDLPGHLKNAFGLKGNIVLLYPIKQIDNKHDLDDLATVLREVKLNFPEAIIGSDTIVFNEIIDHIFEDGRVILVVFLICLLITFIIDFRSLKIALALEVQIIFGVLLLFGLMGLFDIRFTIINVGIFPAILAIGIDMGVHVMHRYLEKNTPLKSAKLSADAVHISQITTMVGFGSLFISQVKILNGIAWLATLGMFGMYFICMVLYPLFLDYFNNVKSKKIASTNVILNK